MAYVLKFLNDRQYSVSFSLSWWGSLTSSNMKLVRFTLLEECAATRTISSQQVLFQKGGGQINHATYPYYGEAYLKQRDVISCLGVNHSQVHHIGKELTVSRVHLGCVGGADWNQSDIYGCLMQRQVHHGSLAGIYKPQ